VFSPNGEEILFVRVPAADQARSAGIWVVGVDGRVLRQLTRDGADPRWLP
jgi:Tol biopolymer transport system component